MMWQSDYYLTCHGVHKGGNNCWMGKAGCINPNDRTCKDLCNVTIITGTGRAGTSFLIGLLSLLQLPTGFNPKQVRDSLFNTKPHAGLESDPRLVNNKLTCSERRQIHKSPRLLDRTEWLGADNIAFIIVPSRKSEDAAASREHQSKHHDPNRGGFVRGAHNVTEQLIANDHAVATFFWKVSSLVNVSPIPLNYPEHVLNGEYAYADSDSDSGSDSGSDSDDESDDDN